MNEMRRNEANMAYRTNGPSRGIGGVFGVCALALIWLVAGLPGAAPSRALQQPSRTPLPSVTPAPTTGFGVPTGAPLTPSVPPAVSPTATSALLVPTATSPLLAVTPTLPVTEAPTQPPIIEGEAPPLLIQFPEGWRSGYGRVPVRTAFEQVWMNIAIHQGPVPNGVGTVVVMWGFPSIAPVPRAGTPVPTVEGVPGDLVSQMLWTDGLRLLQGTLVDITCNVGTYGQRAFPVGTVSGVGTYFNVTGCQGEPETAGWFVGVSQYGRSYLFYAYVEPIDAYNEARGTLEGILNTVVFTQPSIPTATVAP